MICALVLTSCLRATPLEDLGALDGGGASRAFAINESGMIVGRSVDQAGDLVAFVYESDTGATEAIPRLNGGFAEATDVNASGQIVGSAFATEICFAFCGTWTPGTPPDDNCVECPIIHNVNHAFLYNSTTETLEDLNDSVRPLFTGGLDLGSAAVAINDAGLVVGTAAGGLRPGAFATVHFAYDTTDGTLTNLSALGMTSVSDVNELGQVAGTAGNHGVVVDLASGQTTDLGTLGGTRSAALAINDTGLVVGWSQVADNSAQHAIVYDLTTNRLTDIGTLPAPGAPNSGAYGVNNRGIVVGWSSSKNGPHPFAYAVRTKRLIDLGTLGTSNSLEARDINDAGVLVGFSQLNPAHAFRGTVTFGPKHPPR